MTAPTADSADLTELLSTASRTLRRRWRTQLEPWDIAPHHARALRLIAASGGTRPGTVAGELRITARSASDVVDALEARGLVARRRDPADRRAVIVETTPAGDELAAGIDRARQAAGAAFFAPLTDRQRHQLVTLLRALIEPSDDSRSA